ncbi:MAG: HesA/MoeB/ThiF family protein [Candidatus Njordarchaeales archaeon]
MNKHEIQYRKAMAFKKMAASKICVCGAGALGSNLINNLLRQGVSNVSVIDMDRVEAKNVATQVYTMRDVGQKKTAALQSLMHQATKKIITAVDKELRQNNATKLLKGYDLVIDVFDNWKSRKAVQTVCAQLKIPCVHAGMSDDGFSEIKWNKSYSIPKVEVEQEDICDYPLAANLVHLTVAVLAEVIIQFIIDGQEMNREITLRDIGIHIT